VKLPFADIAPVNEVAALLFEATASADKFFDNPLDGMLAAFSSMSPNLSSSTSSLPLSSPLLPPYDDGKLAAASLEEPSMPMSVCVQSWGS